MEKVVVRRHTFNGMKEEIIKIGSSCFIGHCGSGHSVFGENGTLKKEMFVESGKQNFILFGLILLENIVHQST